MHTPRTLIRNGAVSAFAYSEKAGQCSGAALLISPTPGCTRSTQVLCIMTDVNVDSNAVSLVSSFISKYISWIQMRLHDPSPKRRERVMAREQSQAIDRMLKEDAKARSRVWRVLPMGAYRMREIAALLKAQNDDRIGLTQDELISYRINIYQRIITCAKAFVNAIELSNSSLKMGGNSDHYSYLRGYTAHPYFDSPLDDKIINAIRTLWKELPIAEVFTSKDDVHGIQEAAR